MRCTDAGEERSSLKAVVLAAGKASIHPGRPLILEKLWATRASCSAFWRTRWNLWRLSDLYVVENGNAEVRNLDPRLHYVEQKSPAGTGRCGAPGREGDEWLPGNAADPLRRHASVPQRRRLRGMLNRHRLRNAHLTLLTAEVDRPLPYGHIIRNNTGQIIDIIEDSAASPEVRAIREINVGAYVVEFPVIAAALQSTFRLLRWTESTG